MRVGTFLRPNFSISLFTRSLSPGVLVSWRQPVHPGSKHGKPAGFPKKPAVEPQFVRFDCIPGFPVFYLKWTGEGSGSWFNRSDRQVRSGPNNRDANRGGSVYSYTPTTFLRGDLMWAMDGVLFCLGRWAIEFWEMVSAEMNWSWVWANFLNWPEISPIQAQTCEHQFWLLLKTFVNF